MRSIERRFIKFSQKNPDASSLVNFISATKGQNFKKRALYFWFNKLVEKDDYSKKDKMMIIRGLENLKPP
ncbi:MAG: hypothetical protein WC678_01875 [Parcubacteria group bacterium]|jgi:hypothetical protein